MIIAMGLMQIALATGAGAECVGSALDCAVEDSTEWVAWVLLALVFSGATGGLLALAWQLVVRAVADATRRRAQSGALEAGARSGLPNGAPRPARVDATLQVGPRPALTRVIAGPVWTDGRWLRMVASERGGQRMEILEADGWKTSDRDIGRLVAESLPTGLRPTPWLVARGPWSPRGQA